MGMLSRGCCWSCPWMLSQQQPQRRLQQPQQLLEQLEALASAGSALDLVSGPTTTACVAVGIAQCLVDNWLLRRTGASHTASATGGALSVASGRLAFTYGMRGAALSVDTACSSSLVATDFVVKQMLAGSSAVGIAAGVGILLSPEPTGCSRRLACLPL